MANLSTLSAPALARICLRNFARHSLSARFSFILKTPPAAVLIKKKIGLDKGSATPNKQKVAKITRKQIEEIAKVKMPDLTAGSLEAAVRSIEGSAKSMGVEVVD